MGQNRVQENHPAMKSWAVPTSERQRPWRAAARKGTPRESADRFVKDESRQSAHPPNLDPFIAKAHIRPIDQRIDRYGSSGFRARPVTHQAARQA